MQIRMYIKEKSRVISWFEYYIRHLSKDRHFFCQLLVDKLGGPHVCPHGGAPVGLVKHFVKLRNKSEIR